MKKLEKILKQKLVNNIENNLESYKVSYSFNTSTEGNKRISKNQYQKIVTSKIGNTLNIKFPIVILDEKKHVNMEVYKTKGVIIPYGTSKSSVKLGSSEIISEYLILTAPLLLFCKLIMLNNKNF